MFDKDAVKDGNVITSRGAGTAIPFALELVRIFDSETEAGAMKRKIVFNH